MNEKGFETQKGFVTSNFLVISVMLHFSLAVGFYSAAHKGSVAEAQEIDLITLPVSEKKLIRKVTSAQTKAAAMKTKTVTMASEETIHQPTQVDTAKPWALTQTVSITGNSAHPYLRNLWKALLNKKREIKNHLAARKLYQVRMKISKAGMIQEVDVQGADTQIIDQLKNALTNEPQVRSIPDDLSLESIQVQYTVVI